MASQWVGKCVAIADRIAPSVAIGHLPAHGVRFCTVELELGPYVGDLEFETADPAMVAALGGRLAELRLCAGAECRRLEDLPLMDGPAPQITAQPQ